MSFVQNVSAPDSPPVATASGPAPIEVVAQAAGLLVDEDSWGWQTQPVEPPPAPADAIRRGALAWLADRSVLHVHGADALRFLHAQTTNDLLGQPVDTARWHGYCSPKGRLLALMLVWRGADDAHLMLPASLAGAIRRRLATFVLRAKVRIDDVSPALAVFGLFGTDAREALAGLALRMPSAMQVTQSLAHAEENPAAACDHAQRNASVDGLVDACGSGAAGFTVIGMPGLAPDSFSAVTLSGAEASVGEPVATGPDAAGDGHERCLLVVPAAIAEAVWRQLADTLAPVDSRLWRWSQIRSGTASIVPATSEQFVPQMLNLENDALGAVSFTKGCYPGQEVVARSHYLGRTKRRTFLARLLPGGTGRPIEPVPGADVVDASGRPVGSIVAAAASPDGAIDVLFSAPTEAVENRALAVAGPVRDGSSGQADALQLLALPYRLPAP